MKKILLFILIYFCFIFSGLIFNFNSEYYYLLNLPKGLISPFAISYIWIINYALISFSILNVVKEINILKNKDYSYILITNYLACSLFPFAFFYLMSPFFGFVLTSIAFVSSIFLFIETRKVRKNISYYLVPHIILSLYFLIQSIAIFIMNF